ncbi:DUF309 domain-containing protein [Paenibacillus shenyangensis]|uniref:DUF309 domain-containing protein n=1 Tax=Paenibacillus sp. A9 TaxID=1284352 RepID=UPI00035EC529|nr:DUF309 domain-containing protein [Paenibacillus sp. A9]
MSTEFEPLYVAYLVYFNRDRDYFECHEVLEELWLDKGREPVYQGLLQVAVGLYHFRNGTIHPTYNKLSGALKMLQSSYRKLAPYPPQMLGINMQKLLDDVQLYIQKLERYDEEPFTFYDLDIQIVDPQLRQAVEEASHTIPVNTPQRTGYERGPKAK